MSTAFRVPPDEVRRNLEQQDERLARFREFSPVVLWFEHDLFDQSILIRLLDWFSRQETDDIDLRLICIDRFPAIPNFIGLGQLTATQLASLYPKAQPIRREQMVLGRTAWEAWTNRNPTDLEALSRTPYPALPFFAAAAKRKLQDFPSTRNGLSRTEQTVLEIAESGVSDRERVFVAFQHREESPWMGDSMLFAELDRLAALPVPLIDDEGKLTPEGRRVLACEVDALEINPAERWVAGTRVEGRSAWRWDIGREVLKSSPK